MFSGTAAPAASRPTAIVRRAMVFGGVMIAALMGAFATTTMAHAAEPAAVSTVVTSDEGTDASDDSVALAATGAQLPIAAGGLMALLLTGGTLMVVNRPGRV